MNISELSDEQLSRWIAEKLEPIKSKDAFEVLAMKPKCWLIGEGRLPSFEPRDMVHDPQMTVMLLEKLLDTMLCVEIQVELVTAERGISFGNSNPTHWAKSTSRCVAEAFALANGWKE